MRSRHWSNQLFFEIDDQIMEKRETFWLSSLQLAGLILLYLNFYQNGYNEYSQSLKKWAEEKKSDPGT